MWSFSCFYTNCEIYFSSSVKNIIVNFTGVALNLQIALGSMIISTILIFPIHEHVIYLHLFESSFISCISIL